MAPQQDLVKIAQEDFSMLEEFHYLKNKSPPCENDVQKPYPKRINFAAPKKNTTIDCYEAAKKYGGTLIIDGQVKYRAK
ncbi:hypothetical protein CDL12_21348 [Handroanthus impetiginosus]|uniref:Uncharacterized protein n=1 Tax=Handroanthus impetiginosus TaxID=429701 RepID=A0A2G9GLL2_9LAMI|nr:hypothetical protein CDL12_21348 [Handroanthus impetiginosus]